MALFFLPAPPLPPPPPPVDAEAEKPEDGDDGDDEEEEKLDAKKLRIDSIIETYTQKSNTNNNQIERG